MPEKRVYLATVGPYIYDSDEYLQDTEGIFTGRRQAALSTDGSILLLAGGHLIFEGADGFAGGFVNLRGEDHAVRFFTNADGSITYLVPETNGGVVLQFGAVPTAGTPSYGYFKSFGLIVKDGAAIKVDDGANSNEYQYLPLSFGPLGHKTADCALEAKAWNNVWANDFQNVADFLHLDTLDDLAELEKIKGSGVVDPKTGRELIDDGTVPEWMLTKKEDKIVRDPEGKPYLSLRLVTSLLMGACRQLNKQVTDLTKRVTDLESKLVTVKEVPNA